MSQFPRVGFLSLAFVVASGAVSGCAAPVSEETSAESGNVDSSDGAPKLCAAMRGNGPSILAHFSSLARIVEHYGKVDGMAGGSSGSITTFTYESILKNPAVHLCSGRVCMPGEEASRIALALKSVEGYVNALGESEEGAAVRGLVATFAKLKAAYAERGIDELEAGDVEESRKRLEQLLGSPDVRAIVNPEIFTMLADTPRLAFNVNEIKTSISELGAFSVDDNRLFFRTGLIAWPAVATLFGRVGDFYAGYGPADTGTFSAWLDACSGTTAGKPWSEAANVAMPTGSTCGSAFKSMVDAYRRQARIAHGTYVSRADERIGDTLSPLRKLVTTAVLQGDAVSEYASALERYRSGEFSAGSIPFAPGFGDVSFGYWGAETDLAAISRDPRGFADLKTRKFVSLGDAPWRDVLAASPAEPGLSRLVPLSDGRISAGGWSDLAPVLALRNLGCQQIVYVTREGDESKFATKVAKQLGMSEADWSDLYDLGNPTSSYASSVASADAVWCTNWDGFTDSQMPEAVLDAWAAPFETRSSFAPQSAAKPYAGETHRADRVGCTPGMSGGATYPR